MIEKNEPGRVDQEGSYGKTPDEFLTGYGLDYKDWVARTPYGQHNLIPIVTRVFSQSKKAKVRQVHRDTTRAMLELYADQITGLANGFSIENGYDLSRKLHWHPSKIKYTVAEKYDKPFDAHMRWWMQDLVMKAFINQDDPLSVQHNGPSLDIEDVSVDVLFIEPDPTHTAVVEAWFAKDMHPVWYSGIEGFRSIAAVYNRAKIEVRFDAKVQYGRDCTKAGDAIMAFAAEELKRISAAPAEPYIAAIALKGLMGGG